MTDKIWSPQDKYLGCFSFEPPASSAEGVNVLSSQLLNKAFQSKFMQSEYESNSLPRTVYNYLSLVKDLESCTKIW